MERKKDVLEKIEEDLYAICEWLKDINESLEYIGEAIERSQDDKDD